MNFNFGGTATVSIQVGLSRDAVDLLGGFMAELREGRRQMTEVVQKLVDTVTGLKTAVQDSEKRVDALIEVGNAKNTALQEIIDSLKNNPADAATIQQAIADLEGVKATAEAFHSDVSAAHGSGDAGDTGQGTGGTGSGGTGTDTETTS